MRAWFCVVFLFLLGCGLNAGETNPTLNLLAEIVPDAGIVRPPYELARQDMGFHHQESDVERLRTLASERQLALEKKWTDIKQAATRSRPTDENAQRQILLAYAFGERPVEDALAAAKKLGSAERLRLARLLLAECHFDTAVSELIELAKGKDSAGMQALSLLVQHDVERAEFSKHLALKPLSVDLTGFLNEQLKEDDRGPIVAALRKIVKPVLPPNIESLSSRSVEATDIVVPPDIIVAESLTFASRVDAQTQLQRGIKPGTLTTAYLQTESNDLLFYREAGSPPIISDDKVSVRLHTAFNGPLTFKLYTFETREGCEKATLASLARLTPRTSQKEFKPLRENNLVPPSEETVEVDGLKDGYYLLTAEARYAAQTAGCKFTVSHTALYVHAARNMTLLAAVDRATGKPLPQQQIRLKVHGEINGETFVSAHPGDQDAFRLGVRGQENPAASTNLTPEKLLQSARSYAAGVAERTKHPAVNIERDVVTGDDGTVSVPLELNQPDYEYRISADCKGPSFAEAVVTYNESSAKEKLKVVAWCAQPVYRPGEVAYFKGIVRRFNGEKIIDHEREWKTSVDVEIKDSETVLWKGRCPLSAAGTFNGKIAIPLTAGLGTYRIYVDGLEGDPYAFLRIEEFRLPTYSVRIEPSAHIVRSGASVSGTVEVMYLAGRPADNVEVEVVLENTENEGEKPPVKTVVTDAKGIAHFDFSTEPGAKDRTLVIRATATDASNENYSANRIVSLKAAPFSVSADVPPRPVQGKPYSITVRAETWDQKPIANALIAVTGRYQTYKTDDRGSVEIPMMAGKGIMSENLAITAIVKEETAFCERRMDFAVPFDETVVTQSTSRRPASQFLIEAPDIIAGNELKVSLDVQNAREKDNFVLVFLQNTHVLDYRVLRLNEGRHELAFPTKLDYGTSANVTAVLLSGHQKLQASKTVRLTPKQKFLTLNVKTDLSEYQPGELCKVELLATDSNGNPVPNTELSLGIVHGGTYLIHEDPTPSLQSYFYDYTMPDRVRNAFDNGSPLDQTLIYWNGPKYAWGYLDDAWYSITSGMGSGSFGSRLGGGRRLVVSRHGGSAATDRLRQDFRNTAYWLAEVVTDANGVARTEFKFPDDITDWRFTARGVTANTLVGEVRVSRNTMLPLQVELALPRALRTGDRVEAGTVAHNNKGPARKTTLSITGGEAKVEAASALDPNGVSRTAFWLAPKDTVPLKLEAHIGDAEHKDADAVQRPLEVLPAGHRIERQFAGTLAAEAAIPLELPADAQHAYLQISVEPGPAAAVEAALDSLIQYPYGCVEQTMSRFMPAAVASAAMKRAGLKCSKEEMLPTVVAKSLARLQGFQHFDGGWGWWEKDATNDFMTAYVLEGLMLSRESGHAIPKTNIDRAVDYLSHRFFEGKLQGSAVGSIGAADIQCYVAKALAHAYAAEPKESETSRERLRAIVNDRIAKAEKLTARDLALAAHALLLVGDNDAARKNIDLAGRTLVAGKDRASVMAMAAVIEASNAIEKGDARAVALARKLLTARRGPVWTDTLATASAVCAISTLLSAEPPMEAVDVLADGRKIGTIEPDAAGHGMLRLGDELKGVRAITLKPQKPSEGTFWSAKLQGYLSAPPAAPENPIATVNCKVTTRDGGELALDNGTLNVKRNQTVKVTLTCTLTEPLACTRITFQRPCGVEMVRAPLLKNGVVSYEERDASFNFFVDSWTPGEHTIEFLVRAENAGSVFAPLPELEPMYGDAIPVKIVAATRWKIE